MDNLQDQQQIDNLINRFFNLFNNTGNRIPDLSQINELFISEGIIVNNTGGSTQIYDLQNFVAPRKIILTDGTLIEFSEKEVSHKTDIINNIAQRTSHYEKSGIKDGIQFRGEGKKLFQFIKTNNKWLITSMVWDDATK